MAAKPTRLTNRK